MKTGIETGAYFGDRLTDEGLAQAKAHGYDCLDYQFLADTNWEGYALQGQTFDAFFREEARRVQAQSAFSGFGSRDTGCPSGKA